MAFLIAAYAALWLGVFAYLVRLAGKVRALREEARALAEPPAPPSRPGGRVASASDRPAPQP